MIAIESGALLTVVVAAISTGIGIGATWYFARRHYSKPVEPITRQEAELEMVKNTSRAAVTMLIVVAIFGAVALAIYGLIALLSQSG